MRGPLIKGGVSLGGAGSFGVWEAGAGGVGSGGRCSSGGFCVPQAKKIFRHQALSWLCASLRAGPQPPFVMGQKERLREGTTTVSALWPGAVFGLAPSQLFAHWLLGALQRRTAAR